MFSSNDARIDLKRTNIQFHFPPYWLHNLLIKYETKCGNFKTDTDRVGKIRGTRSSKTKKRKKNESEKRQHEKKIEEELKRKATQKQKQHQLNDANKQIEKDRMTDQARKYLLNTVSHWTDQRWGMSKMIENEQQNDTIGISYYGKSTHHLPNSIKNRSH